MRRRPGLTQLLRAGLFVALSVVVLSACKEPVLPEAASSRLELVTPTPVPATPTAVPTPEILEPAAVTEDTAEPVEGVAPRVIVPGLTDTTIRIATIHDVDTNGLADGVYGSARDAVEAWVAQVNNSGGLAGRRVQLVAFESGVLNHGAVIEEICAGDFFAIVGSYSLNDGDGVDLMTDPVCFIPDFPANALSEPRQSSSVTWISNPFLDTWNVAAMRNRFIANERAARNAIQVEVGLGSDLNRFRTAQMSEAARAVGFEFTRSFTVDAENDFRRVAESLTGLSFDDLEPADADDAAVDEDPDTEPAPTPTPTPTPEPDPDDTEEPEPVLVPDGRSLIWTADPGRLAQLLTAIGELSPDDPVFDFVICDAGCYSEDFVEAVGEFGDDVYVALPHLPFEDDQAEPPVIEPELFAYRLWLRETDFRAIPTSDGVSAWAAGRLFEEAVNQTVKLGSAEEDFSLLTRNSLLRTLRSGLPVFQEWNGRGVFGRGASPISGVPSPCQVVLRLTNGEWDRVDPIIPGTMNCDPANIEILRATEGLGETTEVATSSTTSDDIDVAEIEESIEEGG